MSYARAKYIGYTAGVTLAVGVAVLALPGQYLQSTTIPTLSVVNTLSTGGNVTLGDAATDAHTINGTALVSTTAADGAGTKAINIRGTGGAASVNPQAGTLLTLENAASNVSISLLSTTNAKKINFGNSSAAADGAIDYDGISRGLRFVTAGTAWMSLDSAGLLTNTGNVTHGDADADKTTLWGHVQTEGSVPTVSSCGTGSGTPVGSSAAFRALSGNTTTCTWTFARTYTQAPVCVGRGEGTATIPTCTVSATAITCTTLIAATTYHWICIGVTGGT